MKYTKKFCKHGQLWLCICLVASLLGFASTVGQDTTKPNPARPWENAATTLAELQKAEVRGESAFAIQDDFDPLIAEDGGGACATAAGIDAIQTLRVMSGLQKFSNPYRIALASLAAQPELLKGRVTNANFVKLLEHNREHLGGARMLIDVQSASNSSHAKEGFWSATEGPNLTIQPRQLKILSYTVTEIDGKVLGRHFVLLKDMQNNEVDVVDPHNPTGKRHYLLEYKAGMNGPKERLFFATPAGIRARPLINELNTVFTITLVPDVPVLSESLRSEVSVEYVKARIDETAKLLQGTPEYLSPRVWREKTASFGLPGLDVPTALGGSNWTALKTMEVFRHAGEHNLNFRDIVGGAHARVLLKSSDPKVRDIVKQVASGKGYVAIAITEPTAGSDVFAMKTTALKVDGGYKLTGTKRYNARLEQATHVILFTQATSGVRGKLSVFVVPMDTPGLKVEHLTPHGLTGNSFGGVSFTDLFVPESQLIQKDGEGQAIFFDHFLYWRLMQTAAAIGAGQGALKQMANRIESRQAFGGPIGRFTHLQQPLGQYTTCLNMAYAHAKEAAILIDRNEYKAAHAMISGLKAEGVENALQAVDAAMRAFGGEGYSSNVDLGDRYRDLLGLRIADGTTDVMRMEVVRHIYGPQFWKMALNPDEKPRP
ncbi:MAG TPA: acyl-CoA dehydrogenase family protein [Gemmatales bacterium]|nr:acyl-CoA dehydrogenase family protein [Gemmatales bacterium]